jgi:hypothetical protein
MSRPSAFAVGILITSSYFVGACTGRSASFPRDAGHDFLEQFQPFRAHVVFEQSETGGVPGRARLSTKPAPTGWR